MNEHSIVVVDPLPLFKETIERVPELRDLSITYFDDSAKDANETVSRCSNADIVITDVVTNFRSDVLSQLSQLTTLITSSIGTNHIDLEYCSSHDIDVINFPGFCAPAVAEAAFGYMLSHLRCLTDAQQNFATNHFDTQQFFGTELRNKTLGVVGAGDIGRHLLHIGQGFGMNLLCTTAHPSAERASQLKIKSFVSKGELLSNSDFVVLAIPVTRETENYISQEELSLMKSSSFLVNVSRYQLIDTEAIARSILNNEIAGFITDVPGPEPFFIDDQNSQIQALFRHAHTFVVPHIAGNTQEANDDLYERMIDVLKGVVTTKDN